MRGPKYQVVSVTEDSVEVWYGLKLDKRPHLKHTDTYVVGEGHGFQPGDEVEIVLRKKETT